MISLKEFEKLTPDGIDVSIMRALKGDPWMDAAYEYYKKILMEEIL